jgi:hypothetical protein
MAIIAENTGTKREPIPQGNYVARCYQMIEIGTVQEEFEGQKKIMHKVRIGWELPTEQRVFDEAKGEQPLVISNEYTLSMHEKSKLRAILQSWRGKAFSEEEAKSFDITKLIGVPCMLNIIHKVTPNGTYANIGSVAPIPKGLECPPQINPTFVLSYDNFDYGAYMGLPDFIKAKMQTSLEFQKINQPEQTHTEESTGSFMDDDGTIDPLPF